MQERKEEAKINFNENGNGDQEGRMANVKLPTLLI